MSVQTKKIAILFADISGSTALYEKLGDQLARQLIARCLTILKGALLKHNGTLIKTIGDEILCTFTTAEIALNAACEMQHAVKSDNQNSEYPLYIRIGFNYGDVIYEDGDIFGDSVNVAARVAEITRANQIMTTTAVVNSLPLSVHDKIRKILRTDIKGKQQQLDIFQVMWELEDMASTRIGMPTLRKNTQAETIELTLVFQTQQFIVNEHNNKLTLGRDDTCNIIVRNDFVSRQHADISFRFGLFILSDRSSNGTYISTADGVVRVSREEARLRGKGTISLGQPFSENPSDLIEYTISAR
jgi:class 3 adenylate cyclase